MLQSSTTHLADLLSRVAQQDRAAFASLYRSVSAKLFGIILRILRRHELAEEVLQEVFLTIWRRAGAYDRSQASPITWMCAIARNRAIDEVRKRSLPLADAPVEQFEIAADALLPAEQLELNEALTRLEQCLNALEAPRRMLVQLAYLEGWSRDELGMKFGHPTGTIKTWLHRGLIQLKECLGS
jgi:RNA polymerase sigma-70 factor, ECF subfamily